MQQKFSTMDKTVSTKGRKTMSLACAGKFLFGLACFAAILIGVSMASYYWMLLTSKIEPVDNKSKVANDSDYVGSMNGIRIGIPGYYELSSMVWPDINATPMGKQTILHGDTTRNLRTGDPVFPEQGKTVENMQMLGIDLRQSNLEPILNEADLREFAAHHLIPYAQNEPRRRWLQILVVSGTSPKKAYEIDIEQISIEQRAVKCDDASRYGLRHCTVQKGGEQQLHVTEFYIDPTAQETYIRCDSKLVSVPNALNCTHLGSTAIPNSAMTIGYNAEEQIAAWKQMEHHVNEIVRRFIIR